MIFQRFKQNLIQTLIQNLFKIGGRHVARSGSHVPVRPDYEREPLD
jgi:hypothetical protein